MCEVILINKVNKTETQIAIPATDPVNALIMWQTYETYREMRKIFSIVPWKIVAK